MKTLMSSMIQSTEFFQKIIRNITKLFLFGKETAFFDKERKQMDEL